MVEVFHHIGFHGFVPLTILYQARILPISWVRLRIGVPASFLGITMHVASGGRGAASLSPSPSPLNIKEANCVARGHSTSHHLASGQKKKKMELTPNETNPTLPR